VCLHNGIEIDPDNRDDVDEEIQKKYVRAMSDYIKEHMPGLHASPSITESCIYTLTPDENFILDAHPKYNNIIIGAGFSGKKSNSSHPLCLRLFCFLLGHGFKLAPIVGRILTELCIGKSSKYDLAPFAISRFQQLRKSKL
jgi:sarcosine oxidase/L-pipecolate oxidase